MNRTAPIVRLGIVVSLSFAAYSMVLTVVPLYALELGGSAATVGLLTATVSFIPLFFAVRSGSLVDRYGARRVLIVASVILTLAPASLFLAPGLPALFALQTALGFANLLAVVAGQAYASGLTTRGGSEGAFGWYTTYVSLGQVIGPVLAGVVAQASGFVPALMSSAALAAVCVLGSIWLTEGSAAGPRSAPPDRGMARIRALGAMPSVRFAIAVTFVVAFAQGAFTAFFPVVLEGAGIAVGTIGVLLGVRAAVSMVLRPMVGTIATRLGGRRISLLTMLLLIAATAAAIAASPTLLVAALVSVTMGVWWGICPPLSLVLMVDGIPIGERGFALGFRLMVNRAAQFVGPLGIGLVADALSVRSGFVAIAGIVAVGWLGTRAIVLPEADASPAVPDSPSTPASHGAPKRRS